MPTEFIFIVKHPFEYMGHQYKPGETWEPKGGKWDDALMENEKLVKREKARDTAKRARKEAIHA
jgi:hypothetical protein